MAMIKIMVPIIIAARLSGGEYFEWAREYSIVCWIVELVLLKFTMYKPEVCT